MFGTTNAPHDAGPRATEAPAGVGQRLDINGAKASRDGAMGERQCQDDVDEDERQR